MNDIVIIGSRSSLSVECTRFDQFVQRATFNLLCSYYTCVCYCVCCIQEIKKKISKCKEEKSPILDMSKLDVS